MTVLGVKSRYSTRAALHRTREVGRILGSQGLGVAAERSGLRRMLARWRHWPELPPSLAHRLRVALADLGVVAIKFGQMLSTREDLLPPEYIAELSTLQDAAPPVPFADIRRIIEQDLGAGGDGPFASLDPEPLASASIGQVHAATLHNGAAVVVKVRRPGVVEQVELDLAILRDIVDWVQRNTEFGESYDLLALVDEFAYTLRNELDYLHEARAAQRLRAACGGDPRVMIPRVYHSLGTERVLVMQRVSGVKVTDVATLDRLGIPRRVIAENAVHIFLREVLEFGLFHADPHPGNFFVQPDASIAIVDFGMVGRVTEATRDHMLRGGLAAVQQDAEELAEQLFALGVAGRRAQRAPFERDLEHVIGRYGDWSLRDLSARTVVDELSAIALRHRLMLPRELALFLRVLVMSEGIGLTLDPDFHYLEYASPLIKRAWVRLHSPRELARRMAGSLEQGMELGLELPHRAERLLARIERGELQMTVTHRGLETVTREFQRMTNRLALSVILAASVVALGMAAGIRHVPEWESVIGWIFQFGLMFSLLFGAIVVWGIWRSSRRR